MRTFLSVFPETTLWADGSLMIGGLEPLRLRRKDLEWKLQVPARRQMLAELGVTNFEKLRALYRAGPDELRRYSRQRPGPDRRSPSRRILPVAAARSTGRSLQSHGGRRPLRGRRSVGSLGHAVHSWRALFFLRRQCADLPGSVAADARARPRSHGLRGEHRARQFHGWPRDRERRGRPHRRPRAPSTRLVWRGGAPDCRDRRVLTLCAGSDRLALRQPGSRPDGARPRRGANRLLRAGAAASHDTDGCHAAARAPVVTGSDAGHR